MPQAVIGGVIGKASQSVNASELDGWGVGSEFVDGLGEALGVQPRVFTVGAGFVDALAAVGDDQGDERTGASDDAEGDPDPGDAAGGQELVGQLRERRAWRLGGWMYLVGLSMWATDSVTEQVEPREYRVWLSPDQAHPVEGVSYEQVPTHPLPREEQGATDSDRWAWKVQRIRPGGGRPGSVLVHVWDCPDAPAGGDELDVYEALDVLRSTARALACKECGAAAALGPLLDPT
ncbi:DUF6233 domain-containing protein [Streptomyces avermitilis]|uniref:DUF6233 domain-containing protein n=1 Tax=Streptomyces avermitilis TaxID=33903 RepID=UPI00339F6A0B